jgi:hypothetical protein
MTDVGCAGGRRPFGVQDEDHLIPYRIRIGRVRENTPAICQTEQSASAFDEAGNTAVTY